MLCIPYVDAQCNAGRAGAHLPAPAERLDSIISTVHTNDSTLIRNKVLLVSPLLLSLHCAREEPGDEIALNEDVKKDER